MQSHTESAQILHLFCLYRNQDFFCIPFPQMILCTVSSGLGGLWTFYDPLLIKAAQPENLFSLEMFFLYISNLCQPQKVLNKLHFLGSKCAVSYKKEPISSKVWCGWFQGYTCFSYIPTMLTNALPGAQWIRDMGTWQQALAQQWNPTPGLL